MRGRTLIGLLAAVAALGAFIWFFERDLPSTDERRQEGKRVLALEVESVRAIELGAGEGFVRLERWDASLGEPEPSAATPLGDWTVAEPPRGRADSARVEAFLMELAMLEKSRTMADASRRDLGLEGSETLVNLETDAGDVTLRFGSRVPATANVIAEVGEGPPFFVVSDALLDEVAGEANDWRSRDAIPFERDSIARVEILVPDHGLVLERADESFRVLAPFDDFADRSRVSELLSALTDLEVAQFSDRPPALDPMAPSARVTIENVPEPLSIAIDTGELEPGRAWVRIGEETFKAETNLASLFEVAPLDWRSTEWSLLEVFDITAFRVARSGADELHFERREGKWFEAADGETDYSRVSAFLRAVGDVAGTPSEREACSGARKPEVEIEFEASGAAETLELRSLGERYCARKTGRETVLLLESADLEELFDTLGALERGKAGSSDP